MSNNRFSYVAYDDLAAAMQQEFKDLFETLEMKAIENLDEGRAKALLMTKLEEAYMWVGKAIRDAQIRRNGSAPEQPKRNNE